MKLELEVSGTEVEPGFGFCACVRRPAGAPPTADSTMHNAAQSSAWLVIHSVASDRQGLSGFAPWSRWGRRYYFNLKIRAVAPHHPAQLAQIRLQPHGVETFKLRLDA